VSPPFRQQGGLAGIGSRIRGRLDDMMGSKRASAQWSYERMEHTGELPKAGGHGRDVPQV
jgi:hypothetical protein